MSRISQDERPERRDGDRRVAASPSYRGEERRRHDRRAMPDQTPSA
ncbi:hypothetical protein [Sphingomonas sp. PAMC 26621]|nr:hypothetical protein [Sphingomonas sp. PAMC 26621]